jgi:cation transport protein ChaC
MRDQAQADAQAALALRHYSKLKLPPGDLWIFGYGSLMWDPGIPYVKWAPALVYGYHRALCIYSSQWRGTPERPGLVLGLERGGACRGIAFRVKASDVPLALEALWKREMRRAVYEPRVLRARLPGRAAQVLTFIADPQHTGYAGKQSVGRIARLVATCRGDRGPNLEYLTRTVDHLAELGVRDHHLVRVLAAARAICAGKREA